MSAIAPEAPEVAAEPSVAERLQVPSDVRIATVKGRRFVRNRITTVAMVLAFVVATIPLVFVIGNVVKEGAGVVTPSFLTSDIPTTAAASELKGDCELRQRYD
ncbi:MAG: hypothetical protein KF703_07005, partial [Actinobacteria bacterium]|nr:hypothetical protein [Actinomycetota bacterium]